MIIVTGASGFIGSVLTWQLNNLGHRDLVLVDEPDSSEKWKNIRGRKFTRFLAKEDLWHYLGHVDKTSITCIIHLGACSSTYEKDLSYLLKNNVDYSIDLFSFCSQWHIPFIYASSAATYGDGELGFSDNESVASELMPLNPYGFSKKIFDDWVLQQKKVPPLWVGLKFFNVYGPNEYHKKEMMSLIPRAFNQIKESGMVGLFKSYKESVKDGEQKRDFIYVKDVCNVICHFLNHLSHSSISGIYNVGTGSAQTFYQLADAVFAAMDKKTKIEWVEMPEPLRRHYQYFTQAEIRKLRQKAGYTAPFMSLKEGVSDYVCHYLMNSSSVYL